ncbi:Uncharacterised protein [Malacoplasma iowae]|nr:hypothetical protein [Malacoplasma iowae]EGZ30888.1 putative integral membrane protein [Malacoplasma iowae 695]VEU62399.1 Uncharacterised protein [Mycoplasmopsis fermentans]VEU72346.1 Uncharacterised protein [Malacoplasma iowae]
MQIMTTVKQKTKDAFRGSRALFYLINTTYWNGIFGPFFSFVFPIIFITILGNMLGYDQILGGSLIVPSMSVAMCSMPQAIFEFKKSSLLKRIGVTPIKPSLFLFISSLYYFVAMFISIFWCILFSMLIFGINYWGSGKEIFSIASSTKIYAMNFKDTLNNVNWFGFIWGQTFSIIIGISIGIFLVSIGRSTISIQTTGISILITSMFLAVTVIPLGLVREEEGFWYAGYVLSPFKGASNMVLESWYGNFKGIDSSTQTMMFEKSNIFNFDQNFTFINIKNPTTQLIVLKKAEKIVSMFSVFLWIALFSGLAIWKFKWNVR